AATAEAAARGARFQRDRNLHRLVAALDGELDLVADLLGAERLGPLLVIGDRLAVHRHDDVVGLQTGLCRGAVLGDDRQLDRPAFALALDAHVRLRRRGRAGARLLRVDDREDDLRVLRVHVQADTAGGDRRQALGQLLPV